MKRRITTGVASLMMISAAVSGDDDAGRSSRWRRHRRGTIIGLSAAAIIANSSRASAYEHQRWRERCDRWAFRCNRGDDRACFAFDDQCRG